MPLEEMPELERLMLHRLAELDEVVRAGYDAFEFKRITRALIDFMVVELSAFYFDIRKDALYCDAPSSLRRKAAVQVVRHLFDCLVKWLAPMLPFTMEEAWLDRHPDGAVGASGAVSAKSRRTGRTRRWPKNGARCGRSAASSPARWRSSGRRRRSARRWRRRRSSTSPMRSCVPRWTALDLAEIAITSEIAVSAAGAARPAPSRSTTFRAWASCRASRSGTKCARSWRFTHDVGSDPHYPDVSARDAAALRELAALGRF